MAAPELFFDVVDSLSESNGPPQIPASSSLLQLVCPAKSRCLNLRPVSNCRHSILPNDHHRIDHISREGGTIACVNPWSSLYYHFTPFIDGEDQPGMWTRPIIQSPGYNTFPVSASPGRPLDCGFLSPVQCEKELCLLSNPHL